MKRALRRSITVLTSGALLCGLAATAQAAPDTWSSMSGPNRIALTTKAPYQPQARPGSYQRPPAGYRPVYVENVSRHGARDLTSSTDGDNVLALWRIARDSGGLSPLGRGLGPEVQRLLDANARLGYGLLTALGRRELATTARRMAQRLPTLFAGIAASGSNGTAPERVAVVSAGQQRVIDSSTAFVDGLTAAVPGLASKIDPLRTDDALLYFHKTNQAYQDYLADDPRLAAAESEARDQPRTHAVAHDLLRHSFTPAFVARIAAGAYADQFADDIDAAEAIYNLYAITKDMPDEGHWHVRRYLSARDAVWFGYLDDVDSFYEKGPGFAGDDVTYRMAGVLLDDMFATAQARADGTSDVAADLRFTHAEEILPLAALLGLPGSTTQQPEGTESTYADNPFRGARVSPMAANVQWDMFRDGDRYLVRMLYDEKQTAFKAGCAPIAPGSYFYELSTLEHCYDWTPAR